MEFLKPVVDKIDIAGSIVRKHPIVSDIDMVAIPKDGITDFLKENNIEINSGEKEAIFFDYKGIPVNLWLAPKESYGALLLHFSAGKGIIQLKRDAINKGMVLNRYGLYKNGKKIAGENYQDILRILETSTKFAKIKMLEKATENLDEREMKRLKAEGQYPRETNTYWRFRQIEPIEFDKSTFRIVKEKDGNARIVGKLLKTDKWETQSVMINKSNLSEKDIDDYFKEYV
jgi:DNA polymerase (family 10)